MIGPPGGPSGCTTAQALHEIADLIDGEQDERGLEAPTGLTAQEVVEVAVMELAGEAESDPRASRWGARGPEALSVTPGAGSQSRPEASRGTTCGTLLLGTRFNTIHQLVGVVLPA